MSTASNHSIYAIWTANTYTVYFESNGGNSVSSKTVTYNSTYGSLTTPSKYGYMFLGWYTTGGVEVTSSAKYTLTSNTTLYAQWQVNNYLISLDANGGSEIPYSTVVTYNEEMNLPTPTRTGYKFIGWQSPTGVIYNTGDIADDGVVTEDRAYYSYFYINDDHTSYCYNVNYENITYGSEIECYSEDLDMYQSFYVLDYNMNGGRIRLLSKYNLNIDYYGTGLCNSETEGMQDECATGYPNDEYGTMPYGDVVSAFWSSYLMEPVYNYVDLWTLSTFEYIYDIGLLDWNDFYREHVSFDGVYSTSYWTGAETGDGSTMIVITPDGMQQATPDIDYTFGVRPVISYEQRDLDAIDNGVNMLIAMWEQATYTLTLNANGGTLPSGSSWTGSGSTATKTVTLNSTYGTLPTATRTGYTFNGWYTSSSGGTQKTSSSTYSTIGNSTLYAQWTAKATYTVDFTSNDSPSYAYFKYNGTKYTTSKVTVYEDDIIQLWNCGSSPMIGYRKYDSTSGSYNTIRFDSVTSGSCSYAEVSITENVKFYTYSTALQGIARFYIQSDV